MMLTPEEAKAISDRLLASSKAEACTVSVLGGDSVNLRFAKNSATSNGSSSYVTVTVASEFGQRSGVVTATDLDEAALDAAQRRSEEIARLAPANPEHMPPLGPQNYAVGIGFDEATAKLRAGDLVAGPKAAIDKAVTAGVDAAGYAESGGQFQALATSNGLFAFDLSSTADLTVSARRKDGGWSGWAGGSDYRFTGLGIGDIAERAVGKAAYDASPLDLDPGAYTVILEPSAVGELLQYMLWSFGAREADEGRSWLSRKDGGNKLGEALLDSRVTICSDPADALAPIELFDGEGLPHQRTCWVENGVIRNLAYSRFWAQKTDREPKPAPAGGMMLGGETSIEDMIRNTKRGVLVTRIWYSNMLDPQTLLVTGLTRDGNFLIENGKIAGPVRNFRFNQSLIEMLANIDAIGPARRTHGGDLGAGPIAAPPLLVKSFNFSSRSGGI